MSSYTIFLQLRFQIFTHMLHQIHYRIRRCLVPPKRPWLCQTRRGGLDKGDLYFPKFTFKKFWKKIWVNQIFKICYEYINNNSCINLDDGNRIRIVWSCSSNAIKIHNVSYIPLKNFGNWKTSCRKFNKI